MSRACGEVADFAEWLAQDTVWRDQVDYLWLPEPHRYTLLLVGDTTQVLLGDLREYPKQAPPPATLSRTERRESAQYRLTDRLDLRFDDQVIGRH